MSRPEGMSAAQWDLYVARKLSSKANNARDRGIEFNLSFQAMKNLLSANKCYYTGIKINRPETAAPNKPDDLTIDRIDCSKGYVKGNVVACSFAANQLKSQFEKAGLLGLKAGENVFKKSIKRIKQMESV